MTSATPSSTSTPFQRIHTDEDVLAWRSSASCRDFVSWLVRRSERIRGREFVDDRGQDGKCSEPIRKLLEMLDVLDRLVDEVPPLPESQRFGNRAFRSYIQLLEQRLPLILPPTLSSDPYILALLVHSHAFGHPVRLDYGSGHELGFVLALWRLVRIGWVGAGDDGEKEQDELVLRVFPRYLELTTRLQKTYNLEPAGSHGVWGLDDYVFLPYLWGSAQLLGTDVSPEQALKNAKDPKYEPKDLWTLSLRRVFEFKSGPFHEHSPLLHSLSTTFPNFNKVHGGLVKMYQEEVLGKRVVVQHLWLEPWDETGGRPTEVLPLLKVEEPTGVVVARGRGMFIVLEGLDRSGKSTQASRLEERLAKEGRKVRGQKFPDRSTPIGQMIDSYLRSATDMDDKAIHLLFSANRWECARAIENDLNAGMSIVADRYAFSGIAFSAAKGLNPDWLLQPDKGLPAPDLTILLTIPPASASARADFGIERYETVDIQTRVREQFHAVGENVKRYGGSSGRWEEVSGEGNIDEVAERIWKVVEQVQGDLSPAVHRLWT